MHALLPCKGPIEIYFNFIQISLSVLCIAVYLKKPNLCSWTSTKDGYGYLTSNPDEACLFVVSYDPETKLDFQDLPYWKGDGRNHVIIDTSLNLADKSNNSIRNHQFLDNTDKAMIVSADYFLKNTHRIGFDIIVPKFRYSEKPSDLWSKLPSLLPIRRKYLISYKVA